MTEDILLCDLGPATYDEIVDVWRRAGLSSRPDGRDGRGPFERQMAGGQQRVIGMRAGAGGPLVAVALLTHDGRKGWINRLAVDPAYRRMGLAQQLIAEAERWFSEDLGLNIYAALIHEDNAPSLALFDREGYTRVNVVYVTKKTSPEA